MQHFRKELIKTDEDDPNRCKGVLRGTHQCHFKAIEGHHFCTLHLRGTIMGKEKREAKFRYRLNKYKERAEQFADSNTLKNLREEVGLVRLLIDTHLNLGTNGELIYSSDVQILLAEIENLATACGLVENTIDNFLDRQNAYTIAYEVLDSVAYRVSDPDKVLAISEEVQLLLDTLAAPVKAIAPSYSLGKWQEKVNEFVTNEKVIDLRNEIGVARVLLEQTIVACPAEQDLVINTAKVLNIIKHIRSMVLTTNRLEKASNLLMDSEAASVYVQELLSIVNKHITDPQTLELIGNDF